MSTATLTQASRLDRFAAAFAGYTGLTVEASRKWAQAEVGGYNNLGIMSGGRPVRYDTPEQGAAAAAALLNRSPLYAPIRATVGQGTDAQLAAIARSPWHLGPTGLRKAGGVDPYYARIFGLSGAGSTRSTAPIAQAIERAKSTAATSYPSLVGQLRTIDLGGLVRGGLATAPVNVTSAPTNVTSVPTNVTTPTPVSYHPLGLAVLAGAAVILYLILRGGGGESE